MCVEEDDIHLFFTCHLVLAAWYSSAWFIRSEVIAQNTTSLTQILLNLLNMNYLHVSLPYVLNLCGAFGSLGMIAFLQYKGRTIPNQHGCPGHT
jgi:hypothetical protein